MPVLHLWNETDLCIPDIAIVQNTLSVYAVCEDAQVDCTIHQQVLSIDAETSAITEQENQFSDQISTPLSLIVPELHNIPLQTMFSISYQENIALELDISLEGTDIWTGGAFEGVGIPLLIDTGDDFENISIPISLIKAVPDFRVVSVQKPSSLFSHLQGSSSMKVDAWNVSPNIDWYVKISDSGSDLLVQLFLSLSDATAGINIQAYGSASYGTQQEVELTADAVLTGDNQDEWGLYNPEFEWHLLVSGNSGLTTGIVKVKMAAEMDEIRHPIYENIDLITSRGTAEINHHTYAIIHLRLFVASHAPTLKVGQIIKLTSTRLGTANMYQILSNTIKAGVNNSGEAFLYNELSVTEYKGLTR